MKGRLSELAQTLNASLHGRDGEYAGASIDTRRLERNALFFALPGERVDGHDFVARAASLGAAAAVVARVVDSPLPQLVVADVEQALQQAGAASRRAFDGTVIGVTGSNGKTTVKQMLAAILAEAGSVLATEGNLNNHLGVPITLMRLDDSVNRAVIEMGASHAGEIAMLAELVRPKVGMVTNAGMAHIEGFGSREGVARAKGEMFAGLDADGIAVINGDDDFAPLWHELAGDRQRLVFARHARAEADVFASDIELGADHSRFTLHTPTGAADIVLPLAGAHNISNALAAAAAASAIELDADLIARALGAMKGVGGRLAIIAGRHGARLIDDSYNANPNSLAAALGWLAQQRGARWAALGDMAELGDQAEQAHRDAGRAARESGIERLWVTGELSRLTAEAFGPGAQWFANHGELIAALETALSVRQSETTLLIKGSRSARMDRVADALALQANAKAGVSC
ncbi:UDP-N-acetylmuramoyl-tripeptide--D-alanyl-D-alanine ligase [Salinisphaera sp.]|uniref:UDP-N-acetylmuramoyl-tripeptide--D-alanyl-D- alanine ligase n=1 Tax=Salinisphaera sp. TaxID=1914330 RepID=UPI000C4117F0|nr:UDP-N-acetylmuramoyl-tripeptide--D-alanyl-D-alanine ligase [Salinisphaera sp.]MBS64657.1 UDP-N-acetylmuramoyl-tripeptide--D-alanyl-D-alanine ligase [Salinisphaera sp.]